MKKTWTMICVAIIAFGLTACGGSFSNIGTDKAAENEAAGTNTINLGMITLLSGAGAPYGPAAVNSAKLAIQEINDSGGVTGKQLKLTVGDGASDPKTANEQAKKLLEKE